MLAVKFYDTLSPTRSSIREEYATFISSADFLHRVFAPTREYVRRIASRPLCISSLPDLGESTKLGQADSDAPANEAAQSEQCRAFAQDVHAMAITDFSKSRQ